MKLLGLLLSLFLTCAQAQTFDVFDIDDDDLNIGGDIFSDFNEDLEASQVMEDERFFRYGRFFSFQLGVGVTSFDGNRGTLYENDPPTFNLGINYFLDFQSSFGLGVEFSKHHFFISEPTHGFRGGPPGFIQVNMLRAFFNYRYYVDTSNLGTAITWSNPYFVGRIEYWYTTNKFIDLENKSNESGGGLGFAGGFGLEFPIKLKESYIGVEFLLHSVNFFDKYTQAYRPIENSTYGYDDLTGRVYSTVISYVMSW